MTPNVKRIPVQQPEEDGLNEPLCARVCRLDVRLSSADRARIVSEAQRRRIAVSTYVRQALLGQIDYAADQDARLLSSLVRALDIRAEAVAEMAGEIALTLLERVTAEPISAEDRRRYVAGAVECFRDALRRRLPEGPA